MMDGAGLKARTEAVLRELRERGVEFLRECNAEEVIEDALNVAANSVWKPISGAPHDGTTIIGGFANVTLLVKYQHERWVDVASGAIVVHPTHWMPLPPPPTDMPNPLDIA